VYVFWDKKCLKFGQDWEYGFMFGLTHSKVIVLLISNKALEGIALNASKQQDNVLVEYECALLQNALHGTPVFPVFVAEATAEGKFERFDSKKAKASLPDAPHLRGDDAQAMVNSLSQQLPADKKMFLQSIAKTLSKIFKLQGNHLVKRGEDKTEVDNIINTAMAVLEDL
jgi:hypothetical protein